MNVVWFCLDTLRADHLSCYGYFRETSPTIDRLAAEGVLFPQSRANAVATGPGFTSMFTGQYAIHNEWYVTPFDVPDVINFSDARGVFPERIWDHGGITPAAFDNLFSFASHMKQFVRGFEYYVNATGTSRPIHHHLVGGRVNDRLLPWVRAHRDERFFLFVHYWDPHTPYNQPNAFARPFVHERGRLDDLPVQEAPAGYRYVPGWGTLDNLPHAEGPEEFRPEPGSPHRHPRCIDTYDGEIRYTDHLIEQVLDELEIAGVLGETAVVVNADHGEQLHQHYGTWGHPGLHDANVFTPLILWRPGLLPAGVRPEGYVHHIDLGPTILDLLGVEPMEQADGVSLLPRIRGEAPAREQYFAETLGMRSVVRENWKYIRHKCAPDELYDLEADPMEAVNRIGEEPQRAEALQADLLAWVERQLDGRPDPTLRQLARVEELRGRPFPFL
jgi:arylsulfatase